MDAAAERELDLAEREMGGYGVEEERERLRIKQQAREAKLARKEDIDRQAAGDEHGEPMEGGLTLDEYIMPTVQNLINALGGWEVRMKGLPFNVQTSAKDSAVPRSRATSSARLDARLAPHTGHRGRDRTGDDCVPARRQHCWLSERHLQALTP